MKIYVGYTLLVILIVAILAAIATTLVVAKKRPNNPQDCPNVLRRKGNRLLLTNTQKPKEEGINPMIFNHLEDYVAYAKQQRVITGQSCPVLFLQNDDDDDANEDGAANEPAAAAHMMDDHDVHVVGPAPANEYQPMSTIPTQVPPVPRHLPNPVPPQAVGASFPYPPMVKQQPYIAPTLPSKTTTTHDFTTRTPVNYVDASRDDSPFNQNLYPGFDPINLYTGVYTTIDAVHYSTRNTDDATTPFSDNAMDPNWGGVQYTRNQVNSGKYDENKVESTLYSSTPNTFMLPSMRPLVDPAGAPATQAPLTSMLSFPASPVAASPA
jgi:hypothetical protein